MQVPHKLSRQLVEKFGVIVIGDVVEINKAADQVVFQPFFGDNSVATDKPVLRLFV